MIAPPQHSDDVDRAARILAARWQHAVRHRPRRLDCRLENFERFGDPQEQTRQSVVVDRLLAFSLSLKTDTAKRRSNLVLFGPCGTGKDHLLAGLLHSVVMAGATVQWESGADILTRIRDTMRSASAWSRQDVIDQLAEPQILAISDMTLPSGALTPFDADALFQILDRRYELRLPVWVTLNVDNGQSAAAMLGQKIYDRLRDGAVAVECKWQSYRGPAE